MDTIRILSYAQLEAYTREEDVADFVAVVMFSPGQDAPYMERNPHMADLLLEQFGDVAGDETGALTSFQASVLPMPC